MAVKSSSSPAPARRHPGPRPAPTGGPRGPRGPRTAAILLTALGVLLIAACAVALSYNGIYQLALQGNVAPDRAHLYPGVFTLLLLLAFWASFLLRAAPRPQRLQVDGLVLLLILAAAGASALWASEQRLVSTAAVVLAAAAPWLALLVAFVLFIRVWRHLNGELPDRRPRPRAPRPEDGAAAAEPAGRADGSDEASDGANGVGDGDGDGIEEGTGGGSVTEPPARVEAGPRPNEDDGPDEPEKKTESRAPTLLWPRAGGRKGTAGPSSAEGTDSTDGSDASAGADSATRAERADRADDRDTVSGTLSENDEDTDPLASVRVLRASELRGRTDDGTDEAEDGTDGATGSVGSVGSDDSVGADGVNGPDCAEATEAGEEEAQDAPADDGEDGAETVPLRPRPHEGDGEADADEDRPVLPRRDPEGDNPIKRAAEDPPSVGLGAPEPEPLPTDESDDGADGSGGADGSDSRGGPGGTDGASSPPAAEEDEGFVDSLPADDPTSDEADPAPLGPPPPDADTRIPGTPPGAEAVPKRPMVLKPRRAPMKEFPAAADDPPASRVRSGPTPPDAPEGEG